MGDDNRTEDERERDSTRARREKMQEEALIARMPQIKEADDLMASINLMRARITAPNLEGISELLCNKPPPNMGRGNGHKPTHESVALVTLMTALGYTQASIAEKLGICTKTLTRKYSKEIAVARDYWAGTAKGMMAFTAWLSAINPAYLNALKYLTDNITDWNSRVQLDLNSDGTLPSIVVIGGESTDTSKEARDRILKRLLAEPVRTYDEDGNLITAGTEPTNSAHESGVPEAQLVGDK